MRKSTYIQHMGTAVVHKVPSDVPQSTVHPHLHFWLCTMAWWPPNFAQELYCLQTPHQLPDLADGAEGRVNIHIPSMAESCTEGGLEP